RGSTDGSIGPANEPRLHLLPCVHAARPKSGLNRIEAWRASLPRAHDPDDDGGYPQDDDDVHKKGRYVHDGTPPTEQERLPVKNRLHVLPAEPGCNGRDLARLAPTAGLSHHSRPGRLRPRLDHIVNVDVDAFVEETDHPGDRARFR